MLSIIYAEIMLQPLYVTIQTNFLIIFHVTLCIKSHFRWIRIHYVIKIYVFMIANYKLGLVSTMT